MTIPFRARGERQVGTQAHRFFVTCSLLLALHKMTEGVLGWFRHCDVTMKRACDYDYAPFSESSYWLARTSVRNVRSNKRLFQSSFNIRTIVQSAGIAGTPPP